MTAQSAVKLLRRALGANVVFSSASATILVLEAPSLASHLALSATELVKLGIQLGVFASLLLLLVTRRRLDRPWTLIAAALSSLADLGWVAGSAAALARGLAWTATGFALVLLAAAGTATVGTLQAIAVISLWRGRGVGEEGDRPAAERSGLRRRLGRAVALTAAIAGLFALLYALLPWADLRAESVRRPDRSASSPTAAERGRALLLAAARAHGLEALTGRGTVEVVAVDEWAGDSPWWPAPSQRFRAERLLGTFTSRVELLDGPRAGEVRGLQSWQPYRRSSPNAEIEPLDQAPAITFYLPTLQYFDELPFRLLKAPIALDAGPAELAGERYRRLFVTWERAAPHAENDQYELWLDAETLRVEKVAYTVRDAVSFSAPWLWPLMRAAAVGTMHYGDYREIDGVLVAFRQTVTAGRPEDAPATLDERFFHRMTVESVRFDATDPATLQPLAGLPEPGDRKPRSFLKRAS